MRALLLLTACSVLRAVVGTQCYLLDNAVPSQPHPGLTWCYQFNELACCNSLHDAQISSDTTQYLAGVCQRNYPALQQYFCLGCNPRQEQYLEYYNSTTMAAVPDGTMGMVSDASRDVSGKVGKIKLCPSLKSQLLYASPTGTETDAAGGIDMYDGCGLMIGADRRLRALQGMIGSTGTLSSSFFDNAAAQANGVCSPPRGNCTRSASVQTAVPTCGALDLSAGQGSCTIANGCIYTPSGASAASCKDGCTAVMGPYSSGCTADNGCALVPPSASQQSACAAMTSEAGCVGADCKGTWAWSWDCQDDCTAVDVFFEIFRPSYFGKDHWDISFESSECLSTAPSSPKWNLLAAGLAFTAMAHLL